jgi:hypothetical protein
MEGSILAAVAKAGNGFAYRFRPLGQLAFALTSSIKSEDFRLLYQPESNGLLARK